jgi:hypothetical protein
MLYICSFYRNVCNSKLATLQFKAVMAKNKKFSFWDEFLRRIERFYAVSEIILLRTLIFGCFAYEVGKFVQWLLR